MVKQVHGMAAKYERTIRPATMVYVIVAETDQRAAEIVKWVEDEVDKEAANSFIFRRTLDPKTTFVQRHATVSPRCSNGKPRRRKPSPPKPPSPPSPERACVTSARQRGPVAITREARGGRAYFSKIPLSCSSRSFQ